MLFEEKSQVCREVMEIVVFPVHTITIFDYLIFSIPQFLSKLAAQPRQHISNIYIYLYGSYQFVYTGSEVKACNRNYKILYFPEIG